MSVGSGVDNVRVGDDVFGLAPGCLQSYVATDARLVHPLPGSSSSFSSSSSSSRSSSRASVLLYEQAAALPVITATVQVALVDLARVKAGDRVLVHAASGGVGMAAIQLCHTVGATVFGTVGSDAKKAFVRSLGVKYITTSRDAAAFETDMNTFLSQHNHNTNRDQDSQQAAANNKVDVVLNSLPGAMLEASLRLLGHGGRFMELGKRGIYSPAQMRRCRPDVTYEAIAVDHMVESDPAWFQTMLKRITRLLETGFITPPPTHAFDMTSASGKHDALAAFRFMQRAQHMGKVVIRLPSIADNNYRLSGRQQTDNNEARQSLTRGGGTYVVTGGLGGLGLVVARWLVVEGAKHIVLVSRKGRPSPQVEDSALWRELAPLVAGHEAGSGVKTTQTEEQQQQPWIIKVLACDVSSLSSCEGLLARITTTEGLPPVKGVFHAAGVLADASLEQQSVTGIEQVYRPKVGGAWNLHDATTTPPHNHHVDHFVLFSSVASLYGNFGQSNYAAANACLDALAVHRRASGLSGQSIQWGPWVEQGMAAGLRQHLSKVGLRGITNDLGLRVLNDLCLVNTTTHSTASSVVGCQPFGDWNVFLRRYELVPAFFDNISPSSGTGDASMLMDSELRNKLRSMTADDLRAFVKATVLETATEVLGHVAESDLPPLDAPLQELGIDSLGAVEFRNALSNSKPAPTTPCMNGCSSSVPLSLSLVCVPPSLPPSLRAGRQAPRHDALRLPHPRSHHRVHLR